MADVQSSRSLAREHEKENGNRRLSTASVSKSYVNTLEKRRSVLGGSTSLNHMGTDGLKEQLAEYDSRLTVLRDQLKSSVDMKLRGSVPGLGGLGALGAPAAEDTIPAFKAAQKLQGQKLAEDKKDAMKCSIVERLVTATGQGCKDVLEGSLVAKGTKSGAFWKTRPFKEEQVKSSCTIKLKYKTSENVTIRVTFAPGKSVPAALVFEHAPKATAEFKRVGMVALRKKSVTQTKHVFHLGNGARVERFLRVSCVGLIGDTKNRFHAVSYLMVSGEEAKNAGTEDEATAASADSEGGVSGQSVSEAVYKEHEAEFRVSMECGDLEGTLAESGRKSLGVQKLKKVQDAENKAKKKPVAQNSQSSVSVWERLSNYKPGTQGPKAPQPTLRVSTMSSPPIKAKTPQSSSPSRSLLGRERAAFVDGILSSFGVGGMEAAEMVKNLVFGNSSTVSSLTQEQVDDLVECLPTMEERKMFRSVDRVAGENEAEYFMAELVAIDNLAAKVETKWFLADFDARVAVLQDASNLISRACHEIQNCSKLHLAIRIILSECSQTLQGAKLLDITLLQELKRVTYNAQGSLLHFVAAKLSEAAGSMKVPNLARDLPSCVMATQVTLSDVKAELDLLVDGIEEASLAWRADEPAAATVENRLEAARSKLSSTEAIVTETEADFLECAINSGLDPESVKDSEELFQLLLDFSDDLNNAHLENKCIGFLTKSKMVEQKGDEEAKLANQVVQKQPHASRSVTRQPITSSLKVAAGAPLDLMPSPDLSKSMGGVERNVKSFGTPQEPDVPPSFATASSPSPMSSRVSVEQLMHSAQKSTPGKASSIGVPHEILTNTSAQDEDGDANDGVSSVSEELSTPVRNLLRSSRALIDSFDLRNVNSVSPIKYVGGAKEEETHMSAMEPVTKPDNPQALGEHDNDVDDHLCEMSSPRLDNHETIPPANMEVVEGTEADKEGVKPMQDIEAETEPAATATAPLQNIHTPAHDPEAIVASIDLGLAAKLLSNADKVKASRSGGSAALRKSAHRISTPLSLRMSQVPVLGSRSKSSKLKPRESMRQSGTSQTPGLSGKLVSKSRSRTLDHHGHDENLQLSPHTTLTPEQTKAVKALGEVIRQSLPSFSSVEADKQSGLRLETQNLDLDKILSTIILNAGNTPTGPLARGVRGGNETLFDGEGAKQLRQNGQVHSCRRNRKALLEPIVPAPLGMGVSVSNTVSKGISPQTLARSLQSSMRASTSVPAYSAYNSGLNGQRSVKGSVQIPKDTAYIDDVRVNQSQARPGQGHVAALTQSNLRASKASQDVPKSKSYSKAASKDYSKAPAWKEDTVARSDDRVNAKPVFMAGPPDSIAKLDKLNGMEAETGMQYPASLSTMTKDKPEMIAEEDLDAMPTPYHGFDIHDDKDACGLSPLGLPGQEDDSMAKQRMDQLWGLRWD